MEKLASRNPIMRALTSADEQVKLAGFQARIKSVLDIFQVRSAVCFRGAYFLIHGKRTQLESNLSLRAQGDRIETAVNVRNSEIFACSILTPYVLRT